MNKLKLVITLALVLFSAYAHAQGKFYTKTGKISFFSSTSLEDIKATNKSVVALLDTKTGDLQFAVLMKGFEFKKALMQEHFNKDYIESDKFPKAEFKGQIIQNSEIKYALDGSYPAKAKGKLTIHGITKEIETSGMIIVKDGKMTLSSSFTVLIADYNISVPKVYRNNIAKSIKVTVDCALSPL